MRIGFTGAQGTGKTSVTNVLRNHPLTEGYYFPPSSARTLSSSINTEANPLSQILITIDRVMNIQRAENVITDRTAVDSWAYTEYQLANYWKADEIPQGYASITNQYIDRAMADIDWLFYFPPYWHPQADGIRSTDREYQLAIDDLIRFGIRKFYPDMDRVVWMPNVSVEERAELVLSYIRG